MANVGFITNDATDPYLPGDDPIIDRVDTTLGHTVYVTAATGGITASAVDTFISTNSLDLIVITSSVVLTDADDDIFANITIPLLHLEGYNYDDDYICDPGNGETSTTYTAITIDAPSHPAAGGLTGSVTILSSARRLNYASETTIAPGATVIASVGTNEAVIWGIEAGGELADASTAGARIGGGPWIYDGFGVATTDGETLFDEMIAWLLNTTTEATATSTSLVGTLAGSSASGQAYDATQTVPDLKIEALFSPGVWTDITDDIRHSHPPQIDYGRTEDLGVVGPGILRCAVDNQDRDYEPGFAGRHGDVIYPMVCIRATATFYGVDWPMFMGDVHEWIPEYPGKVGAITHLVAIDRTAELAENAIDGGFRSTYITDAPTGSLHWPLDEQEGANFREILTPTAADISTTGIELGEDTFATSGVSRRQYPRVRADDNGLDSSEDGATAGEVTVAAWVRAVGASDDPWTLLEIRNTAATRYTINIEVEADGGITIDWTNDGTTAGAITVVATSDLMDGDWHYVALTRTGSGTSWTIDAYIDGVAVASAITGPAESPWSTTSDVVRWFDGFDGYVAEASYILEALSDVAIAEMYQAFLDTFPSQTSSERITAILSYLDFDTTAIAAGATVMGSDALAGTTMQTGLTDAARAELGLFFIGPDGRPTFHPRSHRTASTPALEIGKDTNLPVLEARYRSPNDQLYNIIVVTYADGASAAAEDATSIAAYRERRLPITISAASGALAQAYADHLLSVYKDPTIHVEAVELRPNSDPANMFAPCLRTTLGDRIRLKHSPPDTTATADIDLYGFVEHVSWYMDAAEWLVTWRLSPQALSITNF